MDGRLWDEREIFKKKNKINKYSGDGGIVAAGTENPVLRAWKYLLFRLLPGVYACMRLCTMYIYTCTHNFIVNPGANEFSFFSNRAKNKTVIRILL